MLYGIFSHFCPPLSSPVTRRYRVNQLARNPMSILRLGSDPSLADLRLAILADTSLPDTRQIGRASCRERV